MASTNHNLINNQEKEHLIMNCKKCNHENFLLGMKECESCGRSFEGFETPSELIDDMQSIIIELLQKPEKVVLKCNRLKLCKVYILLDEVGENCRLSEDDDLPF